MSRLSPLVLASALTLLPSTYGFAETYPDKPIRLVVPLAPGGQADIIGRTLGQKLADILKQPVVIENRGGAGGTIGAEIVARAAGDGYTLLLGGSNNLAIAVTLVKEMRYDPVRDLVPIGGAATVPYALAVSSNLPVTTVPELVAYARAHPGRLTYGSSGTGSTSSLAAEMLKSAANVDIVHVPYRGSAPAVTALVGGQIDMMFADHSLLAPHAKAGTLRLLAAAGARRAPAAPDLLTVAEQGIPGFAIEPWYGIVAPAGTPPEVVATLSRALSLALQAPDVRQRFLHLGYEPLASTPAQLGAHILSDIAEYATLIRRAGIKADP
jgi:tripartite-type tricarboxylate transporter receptor subunit TctC